MRLATIHETTYRRGQYRKSAYDIFLYEGIEEQVLEEGLREGFLGFAAGLGFVLGIGFGGGEEPTPYQQPPAATAPAPQYPGTPTPIPTQPEKEAPQSAPQVTPGSETPAPKNIIATVDGIAQMPAGPEGGFRISVRGFEHVSESDIEITDSGSFFIPNALLKRMALAEINKSQYQNYDYNSLSPNETVNWSEERTLPANQAVTIVFDRQVVTIDPSVPIIGGKTLKVSGKITIKGKVTIWPSKLK